MALFTATSSIKKAITIINELDISKFPLLLTRIIQKLHVKEERTFSEEEEEKLQNAFAISAQDLELILQTLEFFLQQAAYHSAKPDILGKRLTELEMNTDKAHVIVETWTKNGRILIQKLRETTLHQVQLENIESRINLQLAQKSMSKMKLPNVMLQLNLKADTMGEAGKILLEMTHDELYEFYNKLETIQSQLDSLS